MTYHMLIIEVDNRSDYDWSIKKYIKLDYDQSINKIG